MTDEQRPWRAWPEWTALQHDAWDADGPEDMTDSADALCARVWREAQMRTAVHAGRHLIDAGKRQHSLKTALDECVRFEDEVRAEMLAERTRADAAEERVAVLEEALEEVEQIARLKLAQARAALADVAERKPWSETQLEDAVLGIRTPDDRARRRDEAYRAMVEALEAVWKDTPHHENECDVAWHVQVICALALARQVEEG